MCTPVCVLLILSGVCGWKTGPVAILGAAGQPDRAEGAGLPVADRTEGPGFPDKRLLLDTLIMWGEWQWEGPCSRTCGAGTRTRARPCYYFTTPMPALNCKMGGGGEPQETVSCHDSDCYVPVWSSWQSYSNCSVTCGRGITSQVRHCSTGHNADCVGSAIKTVGCSMSSCPVDGNWTVWSAWSPCVGDCGQGRANRTRACTNPAPAHRGSSCLGPATETRPCQTNCAIWSDWYPGPCSVTCGRGTRERLRRCSSGCERDCSGPAVDVVVCQQPACTAGHP